MKHIKRVCIVPARAGSKRVKDKNTRMVHGKPIILHALDEASRAELFWDIIVYTNDIEVRTVCAPRYCVMDRPLSNATDSATLTDFMCDVFDDIGGRYESMCLLLPTALFTTWDHLSAACSKLDTNDAVIAVQKYTHPIQRSLKMDHNGRMSFSDDAYRYTRTQDLEPTYHDAGQFYWMRSDSFREQQSIIMNRTYGFVMPICHDIDTEIDFTIAEALHNVKYC